MIQAASSVTARTTRRRASSNGTPFWHTTFLGTNRILRDATGDTATPPPVPGAPGPMAFLVEQDPGVTVHAHFHQAAQFQVVVAGDGFVASHPVRGVAVHYTNPHTAYGPIRAGERGLNYFTLRNGYDPGARYMPACRAELRAVTRTHREALAGPVPPRAPDTLRALAAPATETLLEPHPDGLAAWRHALPPGATMTGGDPQSGGGQFWLVLGGTLDYGGATYPELSCVFVDADDEAFAPTAGPDGLVVIAMQFPRRAASRTGAAGQS